MIKIKLSMMKKAVLRDSFILLIQNDYQNTSELKNSASDIPKASDSFLMVMMPGFLESPLIMLIRVV